MTGERLQFLKDEEVPVADLRPGLKRCLACAPRRHIVYNRGLRREEKDMPLIATLRRFVPPRLLPLARFVYHLPAWLAPPFVTHVTERMSFARATKPTRYEAAVLARNAKFENMYAGRRCFVIGNGPSLNKQDLAPLSNEITIVMNWFNKHPIIEQWKPTFYCMAEPRNNLDCSKLPDFLEKLDAQAYFYRIEYKQIFDEHRYVDSEKVYYAKMRPIPVHECPPARHSIDLTQTIPGCRTTAHMALILAVYLGCSPIYLIGLDHDWLASYPVMSHFDGGGTGDLSKRSYKSMVRGTLRTWETYEWIETMADRQGVVIYNATAGGLLDVFPRVAYEDLFRRDRGQPVNDD